MSGERISGNQEGMDISKWDDLAAMPDFEAKPLSYAEKTVKDIETRIDDIIATQQGLVSKTEQRIANIGQKIAGESDEWRLERYTQQIKDAQRVLGDQKALVEFARVPSVDDVEVRQRLKQEYAGLVKEAVPDDLPLVFHGTKNIGRVREIIHSHGLLTPDQRGESMTSFATQIDVTSKSNIRVSCEFADSNYAWMPYGAIFAFMPQPEEVDEVLKTGNSSEVFGGVDGVDFAQEPERLYGIITTEENIARVQGWCREAGLDESKVVTHEAFLRVMREFKKGKN